MGGPLTSPRISSGSMVSRGWVLAWCSCTIFLLNVSNVEAFVGGLGHAQLVCHSGRTRACPSALTLRASADNSDEISSSSQFGRRNALQLLSTVAASVILPSQSMAEGALDAQLPPGATPKPARAPRAAGDTENVLSGKAPSAQRKGQAPQSTNRNKITVPNALKKQVKGPAIQFPTTVADLKSWNQTESGLYFKELKVGNGTAAPKKGQVIEVNYIGSVCEVDKDGTYECAEPSGEVEIYPSMPQGILKDSPPYDSSFERGRTMKVRYGGAQLCKGLEEALKDMTEGGAKLVFLVPELSFACPKGRICVADIEVDQRLAFYVELVSVGKAVEPGF